MELQYIFAPIIALCLAVCFSQTVGNVHDPSTSFTRQPQEAPDCICSLKHTQSSGTSGRLQISRSAMSLLTRNTHWYDILKIDVKDVFSQDTWFSLCGLPVNMQNVTQQVQSVTKITLFCLDYLSSNPEKLFAESDERLSWQEIGFLTYPMQCQGSKIQTLHPLITDKQCYSIGLSRARQRSTFHICSLLFTPHTSGLFNGF